MPNSASENHGSSHHSLVFTVMDLATAINTAGQTAAEVLGINQTDLICLNVLYRQGSMTAGRLATIIGLTAGATTTAIDRLERAGYVRRRSDPTDRRRVVVEASEHGAEQAFNLYDDLIDAAARLSATYSDEQLALMHDLLDDFRALILEHASTLKVRASGDPVSRPT
jgi:DNA-binding MarR family transcriptional regulator